METVAAQDMGHVRRQRRVEFHGLPSHRMRERELGGVEGLAVESGKLASAVHTITRDRMPDGRQMNPYLVGTAREQLAGQQAEVSLTFNCDKLSLGRLGTDGVWRERSHFQPVVGVSANGGLHRNHPGVTPGALRNGKVIAPDLSRSDQAHQGLHGHAGFGHHHQSRSVFVQPVNDARAGQLGSTLPMVQQPIHQRTRPVTCGWVDHQTGGFVDHQQRTVFVDHIQRQFLRLEGLCLVGGPKADGHTVPGLDLGRRLELSHTGCIDVTLHQQLLQVRTGKSRQPIGQAFVDADAMVLGTDGEHHTLNVWPIIQRVGNRGQCCLGRYNFRLLCGDFSSRKGVMQDPKLSLRVAPIVCGLALLVAGCSSTPKDPTVNWSVEKISAEARDEKNAGNYDKAVSLLEKLEGRAAGTPLAQQAQLDKAHAQYKAGDMAQAQATLDRFLKMHPASPALDYALYLKGLTAFNDNLGIFGFLSQQNLSERDQLAAKSSFESFKELVARFPESKYAPDSRLRMTYIVNSLAEHEVHVARYYLERGAHVAAASRAQTAVTDYPGSPALEQALYILVRAYDALGMPQLRDDAQRILTLNFPQSTYMSQGFKRDTDPWWKLW